ncbi:MAG: Methyltransferase type 11 [uncultured Truepera sp.]|uniref:Methyltransferase type 11 n=1 Tax=uncultured Truepera sp. TaxID=543023 RepID=A0A6J4UT83_9DEIN|nr:MAG: Methyltransferase type 11 [uncultured Truepera sp.]
MTTTPTATTTPDMDALKARLKATWMAGDYGTFAKYMEPGALEILAGWKIPPGTKVLDVGCGAGQITIPAARAGVHATGVDIATNSLEQARARADAEGLNVQFDEGDAEDLSYPDASFDTVVSLVGAMFAPRPERVAAELVRVCRPGGRMLMVNWTPNGFVGKMFKAIAKHVPPPPGVPPAVLWGDEATVRERLHDGVCDLKLTRRVYPKFDYPFAVPQVVEFFRQNYGPTQRAFAALDEGAQEALRGDLEGVFSAHNRAGDGTTSLESEYLEVVAIRC